MHHLAQHGRKRGAATSDSELPLRLYSFVRLAILVVREMTMLTATRLTGVVEVACFVP